MGRKPAPPAKGKKDASTGNTSHAVPIQPVAPSWPPFKPSLPVAELSLETIVPGKVVVVRNFFPRSLCGQYVSFLRSLPLTTTPGKPRRGEAVRVNDRFQVDDQGFARRLWSDTGLRDLLLAAVGEVQSRDLWNGEVMGLSPNIRVYRYSKGMFFDCHYDDSNNISLSVPSAEGKDVVIPCKTTWTLLLYLTSAAEGCAGGETVFHPHDRQSAKEEIAVAPETGMLLLHKHGHDCMLHEGREVTAGEKWVLRTDLCVKQ